VGNWHPTLQDDLAVTS